MARTQHSLLLSNCLRKVLPRASALVCALIMGFVSPSFAQTAEDVEDAADYLQASSEARNPARQPVLSFFKVSSNVLGASSFT